MQYTKNANIFEKISYFYCLHCFTVNEVDENRQIKLNDKLLEGTVSHNHQPLKMILCYKRRTIYDKSSEQQCFMRDFTFT